MNTTIETINPATGKKGKTYKKPSLKKILKKIENTDKAAQQWKKVSFKKRAKQMYQAADLLEKHKDKYARLMTNEMGKVISESKNEIEKCAWVCRYYAKHARRFLRNEKVKTDASKSYITMQPLGVILAVMPWNFPFWQVFRFAAPALMAGNGALLKHASNVPGCAKAIENLLREAGFPKYLFSNLLLDAAEVEPVIHHSAVRAVTLTGSERAGASVAAIAGQRIKKTVLELGGSDAYIILNDADLEQATEICKNSRLLNAGQSCIGAKRFIVVREVYDAFLKRFVSKMQNAKTGNPMSKKTDLGPLARQDLRDTLHTQVQESVRLGAQCILGGELPNGRGNFYPPTILTNVKPGMPAYEEELFGPVAAVIMARNEKEAIKIANDSKFGLGAAVFTKNLKKGERIARQRLQAGNCFVNAMVKSDPRLPFGGIKTSGYGRELSHYGIKEFVNIKTVWIK